MNENQQKHTIGKDPQGDPRYWNYQTSGILKMLKKQKMKI